MRAKERFSSALTFNFDHVAVSCIDPRPRHAIASAVVPPRRDRCLHDDFDANKDVVSNDNTLDAVPREVSLYIHKLIVNFRSRVKDISIKNILGRHESVTEIERRTER